MISISELILRIALGAVLGGVIGFERDLHGRHVGLRTHLIVSMASATFMVVSAHFVYFQHYLGTEHVEVDASRIAASVVSGIGFLAGGAILRTGATVQGLTTAAGLWLVTAIGLAAGAGMFAVGGAVTAMGLAALTVMRLFEDKDDQPAKRWVELEISAGDSVVPRMLELLTGLGLRLGDFDYDRRVAERRILLSFEARIPRSLPFPKLIGALEADHDVVRVVLKTPR